MPEIIIWLLLIFLFSCSVKPENYTDVKPKKSTFVKMDSVLNVKFQTYNPAYFKDDTEHKILIDYYDPEFYAKDSSNQITPLQFYLRNVSRKLPKGFLCIIELRTDYPGVMKEIRLVGYNYKGKEFPQALDLVKLLNNLIFVKPYAHEPKSKKLSMVLQNN